MKVTAVKQDTPPTSVKNPNFPTNQTSRPQKQQAANWDTLINDLSWVFLRVTEIMI